MPCRGVIRLTDEQRDALIKSAHFPNHPTKEEVMEEEEEESQTQPFIDSLETTNSTSRPPLPPVPTWQQS